MTASRLLRRLSVVLLGLALTACSSTSPSSTPPPSPPLPSSPTPTTSAPAPSPTASSAPPAPVVSVAADGTNLKSCRDGRCEVKVSAGASVPLPRRSGLGSLDVVAVDGSAITVVITLTGTHFDSDGGCTPTITGASAGSPAYVAMSCAEGERSVLNKVSFEVLGVTRKTAILRVRPA